MKNVNSVMMRYLKLLIKILIGLVIGKTAVMLILDADKITTQYIIDELLSLGFLTTIAIICIMLFCTLRFIQTKLTQYLIRKVKQWMKRKTNRFFLEDD